MPSHLPGESTALTAPIAATLLGDSVNPPSLTKVDYDARGNISYKSAIRRIGTTQRGPTA